MERIGVMRNLDGACDDQATTAYGNPNHNNTIVIILKINSNNITTTTMLVKGHVAKIVKGVHQAFKAQSFSELKIFELSSLKVTKNS